MIFKLHTTALEGFPFQYNSRIVRHLNKVSDKRNLNNHEIRETGQAVSEYVSHSTHPSTKDDYGWFGKLEYKVGDARVAVLFPWHQDWDCPESQSDRSINVYSDKPVDPKRVEELLENVAYQIALYAPRQRRDLRWRRDLEVA